jgi:ribose transport system permease protein
MTAIDAETRPEVAPAGRRDLLEISRNYGIAMVAVVLFVVLAVTTDGFLTSHNLKNVLDQSVSVGIIALVGTVLIIAGGFDLSAGAIFAVSAIIGAKASNATSAEIGILAGLAAGATLGLLNGILCTVGRVNHFVGTLATSFAFAGLATILSGASLILVTDQSFGNLASTSILGVKSSTIIFGLVAVLCAVVLNKTIFGRHVFASGGNVRTARLSGVSVHKVVCIGYVLSGLGAAIAGLIVVSRTLSVNASVGGSIVFTAIAAILVGGNSVLGGEGAIWRTMVGVLVLGLISNGFNLNGIDPLYTQIITGGIIVAAVSIDAWTRRTAA